MTKPTMPTPDTTVYGKDRFTAPKHAYFHENVLALNKAWAAYHEAALKAAVAVRVPERVLLDSDPFCPKCGHNRDISSVSSVGVKGGEHQCQLCAATWTEAALDAMGIKSSP